MLPKVHKQLCKGTFCNYTVDRQGGLAAYLSHQQHGEKKENTGDQENADEVALADSSDDGARFIVKVEDERHELLMLKKQMTPGEEPEREVANVKKQASSEYGLTVPAYIIQILRQQCLKGILQSVFKDNGIYCDDKSE